MKLMLLNGRGFAFCLSAPVGKNSTNLPADVEYVRFALCAVRTQVQSTGKSGQPRYADFMRVTANFHPSGFYDKEVCDAIIAFQKSQDLTADGVISVMSGSGFAPSGRPFTQLVLEASLRAVHADRYPRLDMIDGSGPFLSREVVKLFNIEGDPSHRWGGDL